MKQNIYSIYDLKAKTYYAPFYSENDVLASRTVAAALLQGDTTLSVFPQDYQLRWLGSFDTDTGLLDAAESVQLVCQLDTLKGAV